MDINQVSQKLPQTLNYNTMYMFHQCSILASSMLVHSSRIAVQTCRKVKHESWTN